MNVFNLKEKDSYIENDFKKIEPDLVVYSYETGSYEGSGFAIWKKGENWFYDDLGHCSCYGPTENIDKANGMPFKFEQVKEVVEKSYSSYGKDIIKYIEDNKLN